MSTKITLTVVTLALGLFVLTNCGKKCEELFQEGCVITQEYEPVCGCNDKTYANKSYAECAGLEYSEGKCN
jgi:hypothetical protein